MVRTMISVGLLAACSVGLNTVYAETPAADCQAHFTSEGNFFSGKKFTTWVKSASITKPDAYTRALTAVSKDGYQIVSQDKDTGIISATQSVSFGNGAAAPLIIVVEPSKTTGSKSTATFRIGAGQFAKAETVRSKLCEYLSAAPGP
jgi:hypothetical protein